LLIQAQNENETVIDGSFDDDRYQELCLILLKFAWSPVDPDMMNPTKPWTKQQFVLIGLDISRFLFILT